MRDLIHLIESAMHSDAFLAEVREDVDLIGHGQWEFPDDAGLRQRIQTLMHQIEHRAGHDGKYIIERAELRPHDHLPGGFGSVGCHWSWDSNGARVYHHDNATDRHGVGVEEMMLVATVRPEQIDWSFTVATNLILPGEREITVTPGQSIQMESVWVDDIEHLLRNKAYVDGDYRNG